MKRLKILDSLVLFIVSVFVSFSELSYSSSTKGNCQTELGSFLSLVKSAEKHPMKSHEPSDAAHLHSLVFSESMELIPPGTLNFAVTRTPPGLAELQHKIVAFFFGPQDRSAEFLPQYLSREQEFKKNGIRTLLSGIEFGGSDLSQKVLGSAYFKNFSQNDLQNSHSPNSFALVFDDPDELWAPGQKGISIPEWVNQTDKQKIQIIHDKLVEFKKKHSSNKSLFQIQGTILINENSAVIVSHGQFNSEREYIPNIGTSLDLALVELQKLLQSLFK